MSILIKGMEMPKDEGDSIHILRDGTAVVYRAESIDFYKAVPVPAHGRLIDADELLQSHSVSDGIYFPDAYIPATAIKAAPTIIPAEPSEEQREYEAQVESAQYCEMYETSYDPETGAL